MSVKTKRKTGAFASVLACEGLGEGASSQGPSLPLRRVPASRNF
jgi:hypothetical protein